VAALAAYPPALAGRGVRLVAAPGALAAACIVVALVLRWEGFALTAVLLLAGSYAAALFLRGSELDPRAPLYAALLALLPELVAWSAQSRRHLASEPVVRWRRLATLGVTLAASVAVGALAIGTSRVEVGGGLLWVAAGAAAVVAAVALLAAATRS
jgi:hypothetical protein